MSVETMAALQQQIAKLSDGKISGVDDSPKASQQIKMHVEFQARMFRNMLLRSQSNKERLQNETALVRRAQGFKQEPLLMKC